MENVSVTVMGASIIAFNTSPNNTLDIAFQGSTGFTLVTHGNIISGTPPAGAVWSSNPARGSGRNGFTGEPLTFLDEAWTAPTFQNSWANDTSIAGAATAAYSKLGQWVYLRGLVTGAASTGTTMFTLPVGFRPAARVYAVAHSVATGEDETTFAINTDGTVVAITGTTGSKLSLSGLGRYKFFKYERNEAASK